MVKGNAKLFGVMAASNDGTPRAHPRHFETRLRPSGFGEVPALPARLAEAAAKRAGRRPAQLPRGTSRPKQKTERIHSRAYTGSSAQADRIFLHGLEVKCLIGIFRWERKTPQKVIVDLEFPTDVRKAARRDRIEDALDYKKIAKQTASFVAQSRFYLIETLAEKLAGMLLAKFPLRAVTVRISKPGAIRGAKNVGVEITRQKK